MFPKHLLTVSAIFIAIFLMVATINTQPMLSPASAVPPPGKGPNCPTGSSFNFSTGQCEAQPKCASGAPPNSQGQCTTTTDVGTACPGLFFDPAANECFIVTGGGDCPPGTTPGLGDCFTSPKCTSGSPNPSTGRCEVTTTIPATCPQGTTLSGNVCAGHPIPKGPKQT